MLEVHGLRPADAQKEHEQKLCKNNNEFGVAQLSH